MPLIKRSATLLLTLGFAGALTACDITVITPTPAQPAQPAAAAAKWPAHVTVLASSDTSRTGSLSQGKVYDLAWTDKGTVACFTSNEQKSFSGNTVLYGTTLPANGEVTISVTPDADVDVSLFAYRVTSSNNPPLPPDVEKVTACEASWDISNNNDPGVPEQVKLTGGSSTSDVVIGVASPRGVRSGGYRVKLSYKQ